MASNLSNLTMSSRHLLLPKHFLVCSPAFAVVYSRCSRAACSGRRPIERWRTSRRTWRSRTAPDCERRANERREFPCARSRSCRPRSGRSSRQAPLAAAPSVAMRRRSRSSAASSAIDRLAALAEAASRQMAAIAGFRLLATSRCSLTRLSPLVSLLFSSQLPRSSNS